MPTSARRKLLLPLIVLLLAWTCPRPASADRIFYAGGLWLETSPSVQRLSLQGVLRGWEALAEAGAANRLSPRQLPFVRLHHCLVGGGQSTDALLEKVTVFSFSHPDRVYYSLTDFLAEALRDLCPD